MSNKAECPACHAYLSGVYDAMEGELAGCPSCGLPGSVLYEISEARKRKADADLTRQLEEALIRAGKAEAELSRIRKLVLPARKAFAEWEAKDPVSGEAWQRAGWDRDDD